MSESSADRAASIEALLAEREWLARLARRLVTDAASADDLVQQVWLRSLRRPPAPGGSLRSWLRVVTRNEVRQTQRSDGRRDGCHASAPPRGDGAAEPSEVVQRAEEQLRVARAVLELDEPYRTTLLLAFYDDLGPSEIGVRMDVPAETARTRTRRGLERLRAHLHAERGGDGAAWGMALLPLAGWSRAEVAARTAVHGTAATLVAGGGLIVAGTKKAAAIAAIVALCAGVAGTLSVQRFVSPPGETAVASDPSGARAETSETTVRPSADGASRRDPRPTAAPVSDSSTTRTESRSSDAATGEITGRVVLAEGVPVGGVAVRALPARLGVRMRNWAVTGLGPPDPSSAEERIRRASETARLDEENARWATTDERGEFRISGLDQSVFQIRAWKEGFHVVQADSTVGRQTRTGERVEFIATELAGIEANVVGTDGREPEEAKLTLRFAGGGSLELLWTPQRRVAWFAGGETDVSASCDDGVETTSDAVHVNVARGTRGVPVVLQLRACVGIRGRVVLPPDCALPLCSVLVRRLDEGAEPDETALLASKRFSRIGTTLGARFEFLDLAPGRWHVGLSMNGGLACATTIEVRDGIVAAELPLGDTASAGWITVRVFDPDGAPIREAQVSIVTGTGGAARWRGVEGLHHADGTLFVPRMSLRIDETDENRIVATMKEFGSVSTVLSPGIREVVLRCAVPGRIELVVPASVPDALAAAMSLSLHAKAAGAPPPAGFEKDPTDARRWRSGPLDPGEYAIAVSVMGGVATQQIRTFDATVAAGTRRVELELPALRRVTLRLPGRARGTQIQLRPAAPSDLSWPLALTNAEGAAVFPFVPEGSYRVQIAIERNPSPPVVDVGGADVEQTVPEFAR